MIHDLSIKLIGAGAVSVGTVMQSVSTWEAFLAPDKVTSIGVLIFFVGYFIRQNEKLQKQHREEMQKKEAEIQRLIDKLVG
jgi:hypothetical protein